MRALEFANLALLALFPLAWAAPLMRTRFLPFLGGTDVSVLSGVAALWADDPALAAFVAFFAMVAPYAKILTLAAILRGWAPAAWLRPVAWLGRLAMADVFLIAVAVVAVKGVGVGAVQTAWGLWFYAGLVLAAMALAAAAARVTQRP